MSGPPDTRDARARVPAEIPFVRIDVFAAEAGALEAFLRAAMAPSGVALVVTLQGTAEEQAELRASIARLCPLPVIDVQNSVRLERDHVYLVPQSRPVSHTGGMLTVGDRDDGGVTRLRRSQQRYRAIMDSIHEYAILTTDLAGLIDGWNAGAVNLFGYSAREILGQSADVLFTPEDRAIGAPQQEMTIARENGRAEDERFHLRKDGTRFYCSGILSPLVDNGVIYGYVKIARDLTMKQAEAVEHERQFVRVQADHAELQNVNRLKDSFLATLSHELRNPLNLILMQSEILRRSSEVKAHPTLNRAAEVIAQTVKLQARLIDDLLDVSRLNTGKLAFERHPLSLPAVVAESITALQPDIEQKQITLDLALTDAPLIVHADAMRMRQIAWNLVSNAIKFTPSGGRIRVRVQRDRDEARLDVEDNGQGIPDAFMPRVFELFSQHESGAARRYSGMGIGLALVRQLADLQGGRVEAHSDGEGKGARFSVWMPLYEAPAGTPPANVSLEGAVPFAADVEDVHAGMPRRLKGLRVLVVDDDASSADALRELIQEEGAFVRAANAGADALVLAARYDFDVVISDIAMPDMDGYALLHALRDNPRYTKVPAIACSGYGSNGDLGQAWRAGFATHLMKPLEMERVVAAIRAVTTDRARR